MPSLASGPWTAGGALAAEVPRFADDPPLGRPQARGGIPPSWRDFAPVDASHEATSSRWRRGCAGGSPIGAPIIASTGHAVALTFADRASSRPVGIRIGSAPLGSFPTQTSALGVPAGGPGRAAIAPSLSGLSDGRWLLVWTEGSGGDHDVRAQTLDAELRPTGSPFAVSHEGGNAGQAAAALSGGQGIVSYLTLTDQGYEVWGAAVDCR
jgi:hypothetical protein